MRSLTTDQQRVAKLAIMAGYFQHQIAAYYDLNQGRISEFRRSEQFDKVPPAPELPADFPAH
jgi:hypothetical protein